MKSINDAENLSEGKVGGFCVQNKSYVYYTQIECINSCLIHYALQQFKRLYPMTHEEDTPTGYMRIHPLTIRLEGFEPSCK